MAHTTKLGLLRNNLGRSRTKNLHELLGELHGLNVTYQPMDLVGLKAPVSIDRELERCRDEGFRGVNVTPPYKRDVFAHATPIGLCLFVVCLVAKADLVKLIKVTVPFLLVEIAVLMLVTYFSKIALFIPTCSAFVNGNLEYIVMEAL